jgi:hypothetical protein
VVERVTWPDRRRPVRVRRRKERYGQIPSSAYRNQPRADAERGRGGLEPRSCPFVAFGKRLSEQGCIFPKATPAVYVCTQTRMATSVPGLKPRAFARATCVGRMHRTTVQARLCQGRKAFEHCRATTGAAGFWLAGGRRTGIPLGVLLLFFPERAATTAARPASRSGVRVRRLRVRATVACVCVGVCEPCEQGFPARAVRPRASAVASE